MKTFDVTIRVTANNDVTPTELMERLERLLDNRENNRKFFKGDCCIVSQEVEQIIVDK